MKIMIRIFIFIVLLLSKTLASKNNEINFIKDYILLQNKSLSVFAFLCWPKCDKVQLMYNLHSEFIGSTIFNTDISKLGINSNFERRPILPDEEIGKYKDINTILEPYKKYYEKENFLTDALKLNISVCNLSNRSNVINSNDVTNSSTRNNTTKTTANENIVAYNFPQHSPKHLNIYILDFDCPSSENILKSANYQYYFEAPYKWLILTQNFSKLLNVLNNLDLFADSDVVIVEKSNLSYILKDAYKIDAKSKLIVKIINTWNKNRFTNLKLRVIAIERHNLQKKKINLVNYVPNNQTFLHLYDGREKELDRLSKNNFFTTNLAVDYVNGSHKYYFAEDWGYIKPNTSTYNGIAGEIQIGAGDIGGVLFQTPGRLEVLDFLPVCFPGTAMFVFRKPALSYVSNIFVLTFTKNVWYSCLVLCFILTIVLYFTVKVEWKYKNSEPVRGVLEDSFGASLMVTVGSICQQGAPNEPRSFAGRIVMFLGLVSLMFLFVAYSANIVALLQASSDTIETLNDLLDSSIVLGVENTTYNIYYFSNPEKTDFLRKKIFDKKVAPKGEKPHFYFAAEGISKMRNEFFAFFIERDKGYKIVSDTYLEEEKCGFKEIQYFSYSNPYFTIKKHSSYKEIFRIAFFKLQDYGIHSREYKKMSTNKPKCHSSGSKFVSVGIKESYGVFALLAVGIGLSIVLFLAELIINRLLHIEFTM